MRKVPLNEISDEFTDPDYLLLIGLGFDPRCLTVVTNLSYSNNSHIIGISNAGWNVFNQENIAEFRRIIGNNGVVIAEAAKRAIEVADELLKYITPLIINNSKKIIIDITALSHELLVLLLGVLNDLDVLERVILLYVGAAEYSTNTTKDAMWLSRGVKDVRSVLGFPGVMLPSKKLHLILLAGFEVERASEVITRYEPASLSIGVGAREQSFSHSHHNKNVEFFERLNQFVNGQDASEKNVINFDFSCVSPFETKQSLITHIENIGGVNNKNYVVCPLNTKLSTVGVVLAAIENPSIQICYAEPEEYNTSGYATPSDTITIVPLENWRIKL